MTGPRAPQAPPLDLKLVMRLGAGDDGASYSAADARGAVFTVHRLFGAHKRPERLAELNTRVRQLAAAPLPGVLTVVATELSRNPPRIVVERPATRLADVLEDLNAAPVRAAAFIAALRALVATLHENGLAHGALCPSFIFLAPDGTPRLDLVGARTGGDGAALDRVFRSPAADESPIARDEHALDVLTLTLGAGTTGRNSTELTLARTVLDELDGHSSSTTTDEHIAQTVEKALRALRVSSSGDQPPPPPVEIPLRLGRFRLGKLLGSGGMGRVYEATDLVDDTRVALKVLSPNALPDFNAVVRFRREARILASLSNPWIARFVGSGETWHLPWIAVEHVEGESLSRRVQSSGPLDEKRALRVVADVARALVDVHEHGVIHRDVKPENILITEDAAGAWHVKLVDFGIARECNEIADSPRLTQHGIVLGTPHYMSPEQCKGEDVDARSDVYSLGATLFECLTGRPPFKGKTVGHVVAMHLTEPPPRLDELRAGATPALVALVARSMAKDPDKRPQSARALLEEIEAVLHGSTRTPGRPSAPPTGPAPLEYRIVLELRSSPTALWPFVSNTERVNRALGLAAVEASVRAVGDVTERVGKSSTAGQETVWRENPFEWIEGRRLGILREYERGPLEWLRSVVELAPSGLGTRLVHTLTLAPRGVLWRAAAAAEVALKTRRGFERLYTRIDAHVVALQAALPDALADAFEDPPSLDARAENALAQRGDALLDDGADPLVAGRLLSWVRRASPAELGRIRPLALARRIGVEPRPLVDACMIAVRTRLFVARWAVICPSCREPVETHELLKEVKSHGHCEACAIDFELDFARSVELMFRASEDVREIDTSTYCIGSPAHAPHALAQAQLAPGERLVLELSLPPGNYQLAGPRLPFTWPFQVAPLGARRVDVVLSKGAVATSSVLAAHGQTLVLENDDVRALVVRVERALEDTEEALTAARAATHPLFNKLFGADVLSPGAALPVSRVALLRIDVGDLVPHGERDDAASYAALYRALRIVEGCVVAEGGTVVKTVGEGLLAAFDDPAAAVRVALRVPEELGDDGTRVRASAHVGEAAAVSLDAHLDYFGRAPRDVEALLALARPGEALFSEAIAYAGKDASLAFEGPARLVVEPEGIGPVERIPFMTLAIDAASDSSSSRS